MWKGIVDIWRRVGRVAQLFILVAIAFLLLHFLHAGFGLQFSSGLLTIVLGLVAAYQIARRMARKAIWRLRNRLIVAYLFIAVVPIVLILALVIFAGKGIIGQVAVYLVDTELSHREHFLQGEVSALVRLPPDNSESYIRRFRMRGPGLPNTEVVLEGEKELRFPPGSELHVPEKWRPGGEREFSGPVLRMDARTTPFVRVGLRFPRRKYGGRGGAVDA